jgi:hypothetical protein
MSKRAMRHFYAISLVQPPDQIDSGLTHLFYPGRRIARILCATRDAALPCSTNRQLHLIW